uniref:FHA domain-containing protein n=1 Tax=Heterorhabditis bacteriophora TaxID=37862 RepID=A0A1I7WJR5_HETBA
MIPLYIIGRRQVRNFNCYIVGIMVIEVLNESLSGKFSMKIAIFEIPLVVFGFGNVGSKVYIGRDRKQCEISLPHDAVGVSRVHASLEWRSEDKLMLRDSSTFGTVIDGKMLRGSEANLGHGSRIIIGENEFTISWRPNIRGSCQKIKRTTETKSDVLEEEIRKNKTQTKISSFFLASRESQLAEPSLILAEDTPESLLNVDDKDSRSSERISFVADSNVSRDPTFQIKRRFNYSKYLYANSFYTYTYISGKFEYKKSEELEHPKGSQKKKKVGNTFSYFKCLFSATDEGTRVGNPYFSRCFLDVSITNDTASNMDVFITAPPAKRRGRPPMTTIRQPGKLKKKILRRLYLSLLYSCVFFIEKSFSENTALSTRDVYCILQSVDFNLARIDSGKLIQNEDNTHRDHIKTMFELVSSGNHYDEEDDMFSESTEKLGLKFERVVNKLNNLVEFADIERKVISSRKSCDESITYSDISSTSNEVINYKKFKKASQGRFNTTLPTISYIIGGFNDLVDFREINS